MSRFLEYNPDQAYLLPPSVRDVLGEGHLCFFLRRVMARLNLDRFREEYGSEGGPAYAPEMLASVWLYAYALGVTSSRRLEQRIREDWRQLFGGWGDAGSLDAECVSPRSRAGAERFIHAGSGVGARQRTGATGACGHRFDAHCRERFTESNRQRAGAA